MEEFGISEILMNFHFIRPAWLVAIIPLILVLILLRFQNTRVSAWEEIIDPSLLSYLLEKTDLRKQNLLAYLFFFWVVIVVALAGPAWQKIPQPVQEKDDALIIALDLTRSMLAEDVKPNRLTKAKRKIIDILRLRDEGETALVVYSGSAFSVSPLSDDNKTISAMVPSLSPDIMPSPGSSLKSAIEKSVQLFRDGGKLSGKIIVITDEIKDKAAAQKAARESNFAYPVSILSIGTKEGAAIPKVFNGKENGYVRDQLGEIVIAKVDEDLLKDFVRFSGGSYSPLTTGDEDITKLLSPEDFAENTNYKEAEAREFDAWREEGPFLVLFLIPFAALAFRRGLLLLFAIFLVNPTSEVEASIWDDLWKTRDQQAMEALEQGDAARASQLFENQSWRGIANYRNEAFTSAAEDFETIETSWAKYNLGNALAKSGNFEQAISAYEESLTINPDNADALHNKKIIEQLIENQSKPQKNNSGSEQKDSEQSQQDRNNDTPNGAEGANTQEDDEKISPEAKSNQGEDGEAIDEEKVSDEEDNSKQPRTEETEKGGDTQSTALAREEEQALEQWLKRVPDDPGGLLRNKFKLQFDERIRKGEESEQDVTNDW